MPAERAAEPPIPDYGIDAPGVMRAFFAAAIGLLVFSFAIAKFVEAPWSWLAVLLLVAAMASAGLGGSMLAYSTRGKQALRDHLLRQRTWRGDEVTLDLGAGRGLMAIGAAHRAPSGRTIALDIWSAVDLSGNLAEALLRNAEIEGVSGRIEIVTGDVRRLDYPDDSIDCVVSVFCIHNIEPAADRALVCREIARVLKPGGMALIADFPSAAPYASVFKKSGLIVEGPFRSNRISLGISGYIVARKLASH